MCALLPRIVAFSRAQNNWFGSRNLFFYFLFCRTTTFPALRFVLKHHFQPDTNFRLSLGKLLSPLTAYAAGHFATDFNIVSPHLKGVDAECGGLETFPSKNGAQVTHERVENEWIVGKCARNDFYSREQAAGIGTFAVLSQGAKLHLFVNWACICSAILRTKLFKFSTTINDCWQRNKNCKIKRLEEKAKNLIQFRASNFSTLFCQTNTKENEGRTTRTCTKLFGFVRLKRLGKVDFCNATDSKKLKRLPPPQSGVFAPTKTAFASFFNETPAPRCRSKARCNSTLFVLAEKYFITLAASNGEGFLFVGVKQQKKKRRPQTYPDEQRM